MLLSKIVGAVQKSRKLRDSLVADQDTHNKRDSTHVAGESQCLIARLDGVASEKVEERVAVDKNDFDKVVGHLERFFIGPMQNIQLGRSREIAGSDRLNQLPFLGPD